MCKQKPTSRIYKYIHSYLFIRIDRYIHTYRKKERHGYILDEILQITHINLYMKIKLHMYISTLLET